MSVLWNYIDNNYGGQTTNHVFIMRTYITRVHAHPGKTISIKLYKWYRAHRASRLEKRRRKEERLCFPKPKKE